MAISKRNTFTLMKNWMRSRSSSVSIENRLRCGRPGFSSRQGRWWDLFSSPQGPDRLCGPPSLLSNGYQELLPL
jgi:hypothetical protein